MRRFAITDLHGNYCVWKAILNELQEDDIVYCLGDCADRGAEGWQIIKEMLKDKRFICIMGNHEKMLIDAMSWYLERESFGQEYNLLRSNGGEVTFKDWLKETPEDRKMWYRRLKKLPTHIEFTNYENKVILLSHAGYTPRQDKPDYGLPDDCELVWDRNHIYDYLNHNNPNEELPEDVVSIHGHTPIMYLAEDIALPGEEVEPGALYYCHGRKICLDNLTAFTNTAVIFDLDTFEELILIADNKEEE